MKHWNYHRTEARTRKELDSLLDECGRNCWELVHVERIIEMKESVAKSELRKQLPSLPMPVETWVLFFKQPIEG